MTRPPTALPPIFAPALKRAGPFFFPATVFLFLATLRGWGRGREVLRAGFRAARVAEVFRLGAAARFFFPAFFAGFMLICLPVTGAAAGFLRVVLRAGPLETLPIAIGRPVTVHAAERTRVGLLAVRVLGWGLTTRSGRRPGLLDAFRSLYPLAMPIPSPREGWKKPLAVLRGGDKLMRHFGVYERREDDVKY
jgi:hypothetical protein